MTLADLRTALVAAAAVTGVDIQDVYFDFKTITNETLTKNYPFVFWQIDDADGAFQLRTNQKRSTITMNVWAAKAYVPDDDKILDWDSLMDDLNSYLLALNDSEFISVLTEDVEFELFPEVFVSVDREIAVRYRVTLELWC